MPICRTLFDLVNIELSIYESDLKRLLAHELHEF